MLQIATGRFHKVAAATKHMGYATVFSSGDIYRDVRTPMGTIKRSTATGRLAGHVHEYVQHHAAPGEGVLVWGGDQELNDDLAAAMTLFLPGFFDADQAVVLAATERDPSGHPRDKRLPSNFLPSKLRPPLANPTGELDRFESLLDRLVQLPRTDFEVLIEAMRAFKRAILALRLDHLLAYSNLVFCLESLAQNLQPYKAEWEDLPDADRTRIEVSLNGLDIDIQERVKAAIIEDRQLRLTKRFVSFIEDRVRPTYYRNEASGIKGAIRPSELENCLKVAYQIRSGYAHSLTKRFEHIEIPMFADGETFTWDGQTVPTFAGLARLLEHVMHTLIMEAVPVVPEEIPFTRLMPGVITMKVAPKHALANFKEYRSGWAQRVLSLLVSHLWFLPVAKPEERKVILVEEFVDDAIAKLDQMNANEECCVLNLLRLYEPYLGTSLKPEWRKLLEAGDEKLRKANWPNLVSVVLVGGSLDNDGDSVLTVADELQCISTKKTGPDIPKDLILAARTVAVTMIFNDKPDRGRDLNGALVLEAAGRPRAQELIERIDDEYTIPELQRALLGVPEPEQDDRKDEED